MIYLDSSVGLAHLFAEDRQPPEQLWAEQLVASRLLEYELWTRIHGRGLSSPHADAARELIGRVMFLELISEVLDRARKPFPLPVRTLDALHLASFDFLHGQGLPLRLATYDDRMLSAARALSYPLYDF